MGTITFEELEKSLKRCPFCGHPARIVSIHESFGEVNMVISCVCCGATLDHTHVIAFPRKGFFDNMSAVQLWNMRAVQIGRGNTIPYEARAMVYREALGQYGQKTQVAVAVEEMSELTKALIKVYRGGDDLAAVAEELADVTIMLEQLRIIFDCNDLVGKIMDEKVQRLQARIEADRQN